MVESASSYIAALSKPGTNFLGNEYVKHKVIVALLPPNIKSDRAISKRLDVKKGGSLMTYRTICRIID